MTPEVTLEAALAALGISGVDGLSAQAVKERFAERALSAHPDRGGSAEAFDRLRAARDRLLEAVARGPCPECRGRGHALVTRGFYTVSAVCPACRGSGKRFEP